MLFLLRPRQTWMPFSLPRNREQQEAYNRQVQEAYSSTQRVLPDSTEFGRSAGRDPIETLKDLARLRESGVLTDAEFAKAKGKILGSRDDET